VAVAAAGLLLAACASLVVAPLYSAPPARPTLPLDTAAPLLAADTRVPSLISPAPSSAADAALTPTPPAVQRSPASPAPARPSAADLPGTATTLRVASATPTAADKAEPTLGAFSITPLAGATLVTPNPTAVSPVVLGDSVVNVLLVGTDYRASDPTVRTDTLIVASINKEAAAVSLLSIPRDLFVYVPLWGMARINRAYDVAHLNNFPGGGAALLEQTILYNLGIPIHYYALVNFDGFRQIVDTLGGIRVPVNCQLTEYKLKDPGLDESVAANYALYTQPAGITHMDGALALWYARARPVGGDFFRGYRQRQVLRALYHQALSAEMIPQVPALYADFREVVETDMSLWDIMQFVPLSARLEDAHIRSLHIGPNQTTAWTTPAGEAVLLPRPDALPALIRDFLSDPATNRLARDLTWVEIVNAAPGVASEYLAAETLRGEGFGITFGPAADAPQAETLLIDYTTSSKGSPLSRLLSVLHLDEAHVLAQPNADSPVQFRVILGADYNACPRLDWMDTSTPTPTPSSP
jgi:LCP family protein required for cell wall assembly